VDWLVNGRPGNSVSADDRGLAYGDGLFETIAIRRGKARFLPAHLQRLAEGCRRLAIPLPESVLLEKDLARLAGGLERGTAKIIVTRGAGPRGYAPPGHCVPTRLVGCMTSPAPDATYYRDGVRIRSCAWRWGASPGLAGVKTLNRLDQVMARAEWSDPDIADGLMLDGEGALVSGTMSNLFLVLDDELVTPDLQRNGIRGIMRSMVMRESAALGRPVRECAVFPSDLERATECFLTNSLIGLWPVSGWAGRAFAIGALTRTLMARLAAIGVEECG
jgi:4-amino-4-deoxychorismate lyase